MQQKQAWKRRKHERAINFLYGFLFYFSCILHFTELMDMMSAKRNVKMKSKYFLTLLMLTNEFDCWSELF